MEYKLTQTYDAYIKGGYTSCKEYSEMIQNSKNNPLNMYFEGVIIDEEEFVKQDLNKEK